MTGSLVTLKAFSSLVLVLGLLAMFVWALRRGMLRPSASKSRNGIVIETATSLGERRTLAIVRVDGRRLLIGLTPGAVSHLADLASVPPAESAAAEATR